MFGATIIFLPTVTYFSVTFKILVVIVGSIPNFENIPKTTETFWKETTFNKLVDGSDGGPKVKVYKDPIPGSSFIRCQMIRSFAEYIHILQQDETIQDGIFRTRWDNGNTGIGSKYFIRSGREECKVYHLFRVNKSGNIRYEDENSSNDGMCCISIVEDYRFNPESLEWKYMSD